VVKQVDQGLLTAKQQVQQAQLNSVGLVAGVKTAWKVWRNPQRDRRSNHSDVTSKLDNPKPDHNVSP
ncbi:MAG: hypothetical protein AAF298_18880, partial [Cyanobacteria bacterium P01_A01_bin.40]